LLSCELALPQTFGRYELLLRIGSGGMASVYLARVRGLGGFERDVAIKVTLPQLAEDPDLIASLLQEARIAARIRHPNVVPVLDVGQEGEGAFLVMDYVEGEVLSLLARRARAAGERIPLPIALRILGDALAGLHAAHQLRDDRGAPLHIIHRDFSPQNILVGLDGTSRLTDFGIARVGALSSSTKSGLIKGKLGYVSPEQVRSPKDIDQRTDVFAAGVVAWELVTGRLLRPREDEAATLLRVVTEEPPRARSVRADAPQALDDAIAAALRMDPAARLGCAEDLRRALLETAVHGIAVADASEVAAYVSRHAGEKLSARKSAIEAALARRPAGETSTTKGDDETSDRTRTELEAMARVDEENAASPRRRRARWFVSALALVAAGSAGVWIAATGPARRDGPARARGAIATPATSPPADSPGAAVPMSSLASAAAPLISAPPPATGGPPSAVAADPVPPAKATPWRPGAVVTASPRARSRAAASSAPTSTRPALPSDPLDGR
jgi:hypothetical protein